jgi:hypothetical protein
MAIGSVDRRTQAVLERTMHRAGASARAIVDNLSGIAVTFVSEGD